MVLTIMIIIYDKDDGGNDDGKHIYNGADHNDYHL